MKYVPGQNTNTKKSLGQHWLRDDSILEAIVEAGQVNSADSVLEIGPGLGTLTDKLAETKANITALEFDKDLLPDLQKKFINTKQVNIVHADVREFDFRTLPANYKVVANIPYYLTSNLIRTLSEASNPPSLAVLLVQKEVAQRLCALPGVMSILAVSAQFYFECSLDILVPASYFTPPPKVDSQVVVLRRRTEKLFPVDENDFFRLVKAGFSEKRKTLRNALSGGLRMEKSAVEALLESVSIDKGLRAQALSLQQWYELYVKLYT